ncbi:MAG: energy transducer TonB [Cognaticolwellia sp.]
MSVDKFDQELSALYQQRKQQTQVPEIELENTTPAIKSTRSPWQMLALLLTGGVTSFGIMALISHYVKPPVQGAIEQYQQHSVRVVEITESKLEKTLLPAAKPPLPPKPESAIPQKSDTSRVSPEQLDFTQPELSVNAALNHSVNVPTLAQPSIDIVPTYRVMPKYPKSALYARKSGTIKLQYRISDAGKVIDISGLNKHGDRLLERSAKQALTQWRYPAQSGSDKLLEIEFEFNLQQ